MRYLSLLASLILFCSPDHLIRRSRDDYLPLQIDNSWTYVSGSESLFISVIDDTTIEDRGCFVIVLGPQYKYWNHSDDGITEYSEFSVGPSGIEYDLEKRFYPKFPFPLVDGHTFADSFTHYEVIEGETTCFFHRISGVVHILDNDRYCVVVDDSLDVDSNWLDTTYCFTESYTLAPAIGIETYKDRNGKTWDLESYSIK